MLNNYHLEWLDLLISDKLNPKKVDLSTINNEQLQIMLSQVASEKEKFKTLIKNQVFGITKESQIELFIKMYHSALIVLLDEAFKCKKVLPKGNTFLKASYDNLISCIDELLSFIEVRFFTYLSLDERVPKTYLLVSKRELRPRLGYLKSKLYSAISDHRILDIVFDNLYGFTNQHKEKSSVTFRQMLYIKELIKELEDLEDSEKETYVYTSLNELLVYLNFNSKAFANHFTQRLAEKINEFENINNKLDQLLMHFKEFNQMHRKPGAILNPQFQDLKSVLSNWFVQEILYLEKKMHLFVSPLLGKKDNKIGSFVVQHEKRKVLCILSSDQAGLILRAADELRILKISPSLNTLKKK